MRHYNIRIAKVDDIDIPILVDGIKQVIKDNNLWLDTIEVNRVDDMVVSKSWKEDICGNCLHLNNRYG